MLDYSGLQTRWPWTVNRVNCFTPSNFISFESTFNQKAMGLSQSAEVSEGGSYGYHVHGVSCSACVVSRTVCNVPAAYLSLPLRANDRLAPC